MCYIKHQFNHFLAFDQAQVKNEFSLPCAANLLTKQNTCWLRWLWCRCSHQKVKCTEPATRAKFRTNAQKRGGGKIVAWAINTYKYMKIRSSLCSCFVLSAKVKNALQLHFKWNSLYIREQTTRSQGIASSQQVKQGLIADVKLVYPVKVHRGTLSHEWRVHVYASVHVHTCLYVCIPVCFYI